MAETSSNVPRHLGRVLAMGMFLLSLALGTAASVVGYYNVGYSTERIAMSARSGEVSADGEDPPAQRPPWVMPWLKDLSLVSPGLVAFTALFMSWGALSLVRLREPTIRLASRSFPFPMRYKIYYINMGLLGTIVGFVIAFSDVNPRAEGQSTVLLDALGTALWSTLTAIFLAYMFCPLIEVAYSGLGRLRFGEITPPDPALQIRRLQQRTDAAISAFEQLTGSVRTLSGELDHQSWVVRLSEAEGRLAALIDRVAPLEQQVVSLGGEVKRLGESVEQIRTASGKTSQSMEARTDKLERRIEDLFHGFRKVLG